MEVGAQKYDFLKIRTNFFISLETNDRYWSMVLTNERELVFSFLLCLMFFYGFQGNSLILPTTETEQLPQKKNLLPTMWSAFLLRSL